MASHPRFTVSKVDLETEWDELMSIFWLTWKTPLQASGELTFPHLGSNTPEEEAAYQATHAALLAEAKQNVDTILWYKAVDKLSNKMVGGLCLKYESKWPSEGTNFTGCGFEPGSERQELSDSFYRQLLAWRPRLATGPHMCKCLYSGEQRHALAYILTTLTDGQCLFVLREYRSTGVANVLIKHGINEVDERRVECFLEGTMFSTPGILRAGFIVVGWSNMVFARRDPSKDWTRLVHELQAHPISIMWRPKLGRYIEGETVLPWSGKVRISKL
jgi:hypothetical protein